MKREVLWLGLAALALAACQKAADKPAASRPTPLPSAIAAAAPAAKPAFTCAPAPELDESQDFSDPRDEFTVDSPDFAKFEANFAAAYRKACASGLFAKEPLIPAGVPHRNTLFAITAPDSNVASIYRAGDNSDTPGDMVIEYYFLTADGTHHVPSEADLSEAIYCAVHGASQAEQDTTGRCLVD